MANYKMVTVPILRDVSDAPRNLYEILNDFMNNELIKPPHQRGKVWSDKKIEGWINRLTGKYVGDETYVKPVGSIVTYQLQSGSVVFINDGYQRLNATRDFYLNPDKYGFSAEQATQILKALEVPIQHRIYQTHEDAMLDFQFLNIGTSLTTFEFFHGVIAYLPNYEHAIKDILDEVHNGVNLASERVCSKSRRNRKLTQKRKRHNYSLLYKYIIKDDTKKPYKIASSDVKEFSKKAQEESIETRIRRVIEELGEEVFGRKAKQFVKFIDMETMKIKEIWEGKCNTPIAAGIPHATYRWLLDIAIWKKFNNKSDDRWDEFLFLLFNKFKGKTVLTSDDATEQITLSLGSTSKISKVCEVIGSDLSSTKTRPKPDVKFKTRPGADQSHIDPDGKEVLPESSGRNRARGKRKMTDEEKNALFRK